MGNERLSSCTFLLLLLAVFGCFARPQTSQDDSSKKGKINITEPETSFFVHATSKAPGSHNVDIRYFLVVKVKNSLRPPLSDSRICTCFFGHIGNSVKEQNIVSLTNRSDGFKRHLNNKLLALLCCPGDIVHSNNELLFPKNQRMNAGAESYYFLHRTVNIGGKCNSFKHHIIKFALQGVETDFFICITDVGTIYLLWSSNISIGNFENFRYNWSDDVFQYFSHKFRRCSALSMELRNISICKSFRKEKPIFILNDIGKCIDCYNIYSDKLKAEFVGHNLEMINGKISCIGFSDLILAVCKLIMKKMHQQKRLLNTNFVHKLRRNQIWDTQIERNEAFNKIIKKEEDNTSEYGDEEKKNREAYFGNRFWRKLFFPNIVEKVALSVGFDSGSKMEPNISPRIKRSATGWPRLSQNLRSESTESMEKVPLILVKVNGTNGKIHNRTSGNKAENATHGDGKLVRLQENLVQGIKTVSKQSNNMFNSHKVSDTMKNTEEWRDNMQKKDESIKTNDGSVELVNNFIMNSLPDLKIPSPPLVSSTTDKTYVSTSVPGGIKTWPGDTSGIESLDDLIMYHTYTDSVSHVKPQYTPIDKFPMIQQNPTILEHHHGNDGTVVGVIKKPVSMNRPGWLTRPYYDTSYVVHHQQRPTSQPQHWDDVATTNGPVSNNGWKKPPKKPVIIIIEDSHHFPSSTTYYDYLPTFPKPTSTTSYPMIITAASPTDQPLHSLPHTTWSPEIIQNQNSPTPIIDCADVNISLSTHVSNSNNKEGCGNVNIIINSDITNTNQLANDAEHYPSPPTMVPTEVPVPNLTPFLDEFEPPESENQETEPSVTEATTTTTTTTKKPKKPSESDTSLSSYFETLINSTSILNPLTLGFWKLVFTPLVLLLASGLGFGFLFFPWILPSLFWRSNSNNWRRLGPADFSGDQNHHQKCNDPTCSIGFRKFHKIFGLPRKRRKRDNVGDLPFRGWIKYRIS